MKIIISDKLGQEGIDLLKKSSHEVIEGWEIPKDDLANHLADVDAIIIRSATKLKGDLLEAAKNLKVIGRAGIGLDNIDLKKAKERGIVVRNTPKATTITVAELALTYIMACSRDIVTGTIGLREDVSKFKSLKKQLKGIEVYGKTLGIIGYGRIGYALATRCQALGMKILAYKRHPPASPPGGIKFVPLDELIAQSDFLSLHTPLTDETKHMISTEQFNKMKKGVALIDCSRGAVVDGEALYKALIDGKVRIAALDVFEKEPPVGNRLLTLPNVICTPHIGAQTGEGQTRAGIQVAEVVLEELEKIK